jgi:hypothetical protein
MGKNDLWIRVLLRTAGMAVLAALFIATVPAARTQTTPAVTGEKTLLPGFHRSPYFGEQVREEWIEPGVRAVLNAPPNLDASRPTRLIVYAAPNGNTIEQTLGSVRAKETDWHFDIQHLAAQTRRLREILPGENIVAACVEAEGLSWPAWRRKHPDNAARIRRMVEGWRDALRKYLPGSPVRVALTGHSGGGSFLFGFINGGEAIPDYVERIAFLDANYSYSDADRHGDKLLAWLREDAARRLVVIAYDDREITLDGKKVIGPDGGTFRGSLRMITRFRQDTPLSEARSGDFQTTSGLNGQIQLFLHPNPQNKILHTALVGEMNGYLQAMTQGTPQAAGWGTFGGPRAYTKWIQPAAGIPARPADAIGGAAFMMRISDLPPAAREEAIAEEVLRGNIPDFLRRFVTLTVRETDAAGKEHTLAYEVMPDYLAIGSDADFVRIPMTPMTAQRIADAFACALPTRKVVDDVYREAAVKLEPRPLTEEREAVKTFVQHQKIIEEQRAGKPLGLLVAGDKKDVVVTNRLTEKPNRVAIYGWHKPDGKPIQPLTIVHRDTYVDYSHGIRLMKRAVLLDGKPRDIRDILRSPELCPLLSDEGPLRVPGY